MLNHIHRVLDQLGLTTLKRAIHVQFSNAELNTQVFLQRIEGKHALNVGSRITGIITQASQLQSDGAFTVYRLVLQDATALWHKRRNSRVFMNKSVPEISEILFKEWQEKSTLFNASLSLNLSGLTQNYDVRPFVMQANETDYDFLTRLWRSEGINWLVDETSLIVSHALQAIESQKLRLIDDQLQFTALNRGIIRFHRSHATERFDSMTSLVAHNVGKRILCNRMMEVAHC